MRLLIGLMIMIVVGCTQGREAVPAGGEVASVVQRAKARGESRAVIRSLIERSTRGDLDTVLSASSVLVATPLNSWVEVTRDHIVTWQRFRVERWLSERPFDPECSGRRSAEPSDGVVLGLDKGTAVVEGIEVREVTMEHIEFARGKTYLLLVSRCPNGIVGIPHLENAAFEVSEAGAISLPPFGNGNAPYVRQIMQLGTVDALHDYVTRRTPS